MPYRPRSTDLWFNAPGVVAAYQPVACPAGALAARINVANEQRTPGQYAAAPGVAPTHDPRYGWTFNGTTQYLTTGFVPSDLSWSVLVMVSGIVSTAALYMYIGAVGALRWGIQQNTSKYQYYNGDGSGKLGSTSVSTSAIVGFAGNTGYLNGAVEVTGIPTSAGVLLSPYIGARNSNGTASTFTAGNILAVVICSVTLAPSQVWQFSRQMAYCDANPDWSAWGRRRRYYYAPSVAAGAVHISPSRTVGGDGGRVAIRPVRWYQ